MPQSLARMPVHLIFSTKNRLRSIPDDLRDQLHRYAAGIINNHGCHSLLINSVEDHIHVLFDLGRTVTLSKMVQEVKTATSAWIKTKGPQHRLFAWQSGYAGFAVSPGDIRSISDYISGQREHHRRESFQEEYRRFLTEYGIDFDELYVWD